MKDKILQLNENDVTIEPIAESCECERDYATHFVMVDYRSAGMKAEVGRYCHDCALVVAERIKEGLPDAPRPPAQCNKTPLCAKPEGHDGECDEIPF